ncbi:MAG: AtpZ/AtpI family protein [Candidatus Eisenbacteria bacterium]|nr:AtpZ/AtpI family protein [Candidatus Eisenbacteria bacterium]
MRDGRKGQRGDDPRTYYRSVLALMTIPFVLGVAPVIGWWFGRWVDRKAGTDWVFQAIGVALGLGAGVRETILVIRKVQRDLDR